MTSMEWRVYPLCVTPSCVCTQPQDLPFTYRFSYILGSSEAEVPLVSSELTSNTYAPFNLPSVPGYTTSAPVYFAV
jgi:hypothetical protein